MTVLPILDTTYPVLIFKLRRGVIHHGAVGVARSLGRLGVPVYAIVEDGYTPLAASRHVTKCFIWKSWPRDREAFLIAMSNIGNMLNHPTILIPLDDLSAVSVAENAGALSQWFLFPQVPWDLPRQLADKASLYSLCARNSVPCARSMVPSSMDDLREFTKDTTFPIVVKAAKQWRLLNDRYNVKVIPTQKALLEFSGQIEFGEDSPMILQEYIPGEDWIYHGYCNPKMNLYLNFTGKKLLDYPPGSGSTAVGISCNNDELCLEAENFLRAFSYSGIVDMDWRQDQRDGRYKLMDCNPRVGMNFRMFENGAAIDVVRAQHLDLTGRGVDCSPMVEGRRFIVEPFFILSSIRGGRSSTIEATRRAPAEKREFAWWSSDDKLPLLVMSVRLISQTVQRSLQRVWERFKTLLM